MVVEEEEVVVVDEEEVEEGSMGGVTRHDPGYSQQKPLLANSA